MLISIWIWFALGQAVHLLLQLQAVSKAPNNPAQSILGALKQRWVQVLCRVFATTALFLSIYYSPDFVLRVLNALGLQFASGHESNFLNPGTAGFAGYFLDSLFGYLPGLKGKVPKIDPGGDD